MTALELISLATQALYVLIFCLVAVQALARRRRASWDIALFFGAVTIIVLESRISALAGATPSPLVTAIIIAFVLALPYFLLRLVADFLSVPGWLVHTSEAGLVVIAVAWSIAPTPAPAPLVLALVLYFVTLSAYCAGAFIAEALRSTGVTRRRMQAVAVGTLLLGGDVFLAGVTALTPDQFDPVISSVGQILGFLSGIAYFIGFEPPLILRRAWQEPELRAFLQRAASLPRLPDTRSIIMALERGVAGTLGARATIGVHDPLTNVLRFQDPYGVLPNEVGPSGFLVWRVFDEQEPAYFPDVQRAHPELAAAYRGHGIASVLISPISAGEKHLGALEVYTDRPPIFSDDDLELVTLFADQAAVILESRALIDDAARVRAHEEAARLKEDFISAAAHDLKTPLTTLVAQAQFLERQAQLTPSAPADLSGIQRIVREAKRLSALVLELLDASRLEQGRLIGEREPLDLVELAREVAGRDAYRTHRVQVYADAPVVGTYDVRRIEQLFENLVENAVKYSPESSIVRVDVAGHDGQATVDVADEGIGIPPEDLPYVFERFRRATNVDDRRFAGMGLGLFICRGIVEQHGGRIRVESTIGTGTTFHVTLPSEGRD